jgi:chloride channel protein, CIC family
VKFLYVGLARFFTGFELKSTGKWFLLSALIGIVAGLGAIFFQFAIQVVVHFALGEITGYVPPETAGEKSIFAPPQTEFRPLLIIVVMMAGGAVSGFLVYRFAPEAEGHGTDAAIDSFHNKRGYIRPQVPVIKTLASALTLGTGGSGGREGPIAQIGAGFGSFLATRLKLPARDRRIMMAAGMGAGIGAIFRAPLAGALFAAEILYSTADLEAEVLVPSAVASIIAYSVYELCLPMNVRFVPVFGNKLDYSIGSPLELIPLALLAVILTLAAIGFIKAFYGTHNLFRKLSISHYLRPVIGAGLAGVVGLSLFYAFGHNKEAMPVLTVLSTGHGALQMAIEEGASLGVPLLLAIGFGKLVTTSLTIGSGGSGGVFGPSVLIGGCLGTAIGQLLHEIWPQMVPNAQVYGIVGMAGFFAAAAHAPISTIIMVSEMTGDYKLLLPTMWVATLSFLLCRQWKLYQMQVPTRLDSPAHRGDFLIDVLEGILVRDVPTGERPLVRVPEGTPLKRIMEMLTETRQHYFPVVDAEGRMLGIFSSDDVRAYLFDDAIWPLAVARDVMTSRLVTVTPEDDLNTALCRFTQLNLDELPIVDPQDRSQLLGMLRRKDTIAVYNRRLAELKDPDGDHPDGVHRPNTVSAVH